RWRTLLPAAERHPEDVGAPLGTCDIVGSGVGDDGGRLRAVQQVANGQSVSAADQPQQHVHSVLLHQLASFQQRVLGCGAFILLDDVGLQASDYAVVLVQVDVDRVRHVW